MSYDWDLLEPTEEEIAARSMTDVLYSSDFTSGQGKYFNFYSDDFILSKKIKIKVTVGYIREKENINRVVIEKFKENKGVWQKTNEKIVLSSFTFEKLMSFLSFLKGLDLKGISERSIRLTEDLFERFDDIAKKKIKTFLSTEEGQKFIEELIRGGVLSKDVTNVAYRRNQLEIFDKLLNDQDFLEKYRQQEGIKDSRKESVWQHFFEQNSWIFGYGLSYIFCSNLPDKQLEQVVAGFTFSKKGKRIDALLQTIGDIQHFVLVEIKLPEEKLIGGNPRPGCWSISNSVMDGIAQIQKTTELFKSEYFEKSEAIDEQGNPTGDVTFNVSPKNYLVIGKLSQFRTEKGVNFEQYSNFELFRKTISRPEIVTYDELYYRARFIVEGEESKK